VPDNLDLVLNFSLSVKNKGEISGAIQVCVPLAAAFVEV
jgi:hypothetical protein